MSAAMVAAFVAGVVIGALVVQEGTNAHPTVIYRVAYQTDVGVCAMALREKGFMK